MHEIAGDGALMQRFDDGMVNMAELVRAMAESLASENMGPQADGACDSGNWRNGYRKRKLVTGVSTINLWIPKLRAGSHLPEALIERCSRVDRAQSSQRCPRWRPTACPPEGRSAWCRPWA